MYQLAKLVNFTLRNKRNLIFVFSTIVVALSLLLQSFSLFLVLETIIVILGITTIRVSDVLVYNKILHIFSMSLIETNMFAKYDYETEKETIANLFKKEFIKGILNIPSNKMKCETHKWLVQNVFSDERIIQNFDIKDKKKGNNPHTLEVLLLSSGKKCNLHKRECHQIYLRRKLPL